MNGQLLKSSAVKLEQVPFRQALFDDLQYMHKAYVREPPEPKHEAQESLQSFHEIYQQPTCARDV